MKLIDGQINISSTGKWGSGNIDSTLTRLLKEMDSAGIEKGIVTALEPFSSNQFVANLINKHPDRFYGFGHIRIGHEKDDFHEIESLGLKGLKIHPRIQNVSIREVEDRGIFEQAQSLKLPVKLCGWLQSNTQAIEAISPLRIDRIAKTYPKLKIIINHLGGHHFWDAFFVARSNKNVYLDCSYFLDFFEGTSLAKDFYIMADKLDEKIIFGTDFPEMSIVQYTKNVIENLAYLSLPKRENIFYKNALKLVEDYE